jgi:hypothetical protein
MGPNAKCDLCGSEVDLDFYAGGPVGCMCKKCKVIVSKWEKAKKARDELWEQVLAERKKLKKEAEKP